MHANGRIGDAVVVEATDETLYYTYTVRGVQYDACQDIHSLRGLLPATLDHLVGGAAIKYSTRNPANSMLVCEEWSGLRALAHNDAVRHPAKNAAFAKGA